MKPTLLQKKSPGELSAIGPSGKAARMSFASRVGRKLRELVEGFLERVYGRRHPGRLFVTLTIAMPWAFNWMTPNDKWSLGAHVQLWLKGLSVAPRTPPAAGKRIFLLCAYRGQFTLDLTLAVLLAWRGHELTFGYLPKLQSPVKHPLRDDSSAKAYLSSALAQIERRSGGRIHCVDLSDVPLDDLPLKESIIQSRVKSDVVMYARRETLDLTDPDTRQVWDYYESQARYAQRLARTYFVRTWGQFDLVLIANGTTFEAAQFCDVAKELAMPMTTFEKFAFRQRRVINHGDDFQNFNDLHWAWKNREALGYLEPRFYAYAIDRAFNLLDERRRASAASWSWTLQSSPNQTTQEAMRAAGVPENTEFALVCSNVPFDAGYSGLLGKFSSMREWLHETVRHLLENTSLHVVVRSHPAEAAHWGGREHSSETLKEFLGNPQLTFIAHDQAVNTYGLMEKCKFGVVFSSTTGLEMAMLGKSVVPGANVYYAGKGYTVDTATRAEYDATLTRLAAATEPVELTQSQMYDARLFHFILHYVMQWPFPHDKPNDIRRLPPHRLLESKDIASYVRFLDALAMGEDEWLPVMSRYLSADGTNHIPMPSANGPDQSHGPDAIHRV